MFTKVCTNFIAYDKIISMVKKRSNLICNSRAKKTALFVLALAFFLCAFCFALRLKPAVTFADANFSPLLPCSAIEINELTEPKSAIYLPDGRIAVIQDKTVVFYLPDGDKVTVGGFIALKQIKLLNENYVVVSDSGSLRAINLTDYSRSDLQYDSSGTLLTIGGNYFDLNGEYLISAFGSNLTVYAIGESITLINSFSGVDGDTPIALNGNGKVFYHSNATPKEFKVSNIGDLDTSTVIKVDGKVIQASNVITDGTSFYFIYEGNVYIGDNENYKTTRLTVSYDERFNLGKLVSPVGMSFKNGNLLITDDSLSAIQEFKVEGDKLVFTGFAVAKGKTAFNRTVNPTVVKNNGKAVAVIDGDKLTVIKNADGDLYDAENFFSYTFNHEFDFIPNALALGKTCALIAEKSESKLRLINYRSGEVSEVKTIEKNNITDVSYANGYFYVSRIMNGDTPGTIIFSLDKIEENAALYSQQTVLTTENEFVGGTLISADVYGNVCIYSEGYFYRAVRTQYYNYGEKLNQAAIENVKCLATDFGGNLFFLTDEGIFYLNEEGEKERVSTQSAISFTLCFDRKTAYFIKDAEEKIYKTDDLYNLSADSIPVEGGLNLSGETADIENFKTYSLSYSATAFVVNYDSGALLYSEVGTSEGDFLLVKTFTYSTCDDVYIELKVLLGYDENSKPLLITVKSNDALIDTTNVKAERTKIYVSTDVNFYYIPLITENDICCVKNGDGILRIAAGTEIDATHKITDVNGTFYYAPLTDDSGTTVYGYIPEKFTVTELPERAYASTTLSEIKGDRANALRNSLVVIALAASVFGTSLFFILKKSKG